MKRLVLSITFFISSIGYGEFRIDANESLASVQQRLIFEYERQSEENDSIEIESLKIELNPVEIDNSSFLGRNVEKSLETCRKLAANLSAFESAFAELKPDCELVARDNKVWLRTYLVSKKHKLKKAYACEMYFFL